MMRQKAEGGFVKGASDIIIPAATSFVCEMKSINKSSKLSQEQVEYLEACDRSGAFSLVAYGYKAAWEALNVWLKKYDIE